MIIKYLAVEVAADVDGCGSLSFGERNDMISLGERLQIFFAYGQYSVFVNGIAVCRNFFPSAVNSSTASEVRPSIVTVISVSSEIFFGSLSAFGVL